MGVALPALVVGMRAIGHPANILIIMQEIVEAVAAKGAAPLGTDAVPVEPLNDLPIAPPGGVLSKDPLDNLRLCRIDLQPLVHYAITEGWLASGVLAGAGLVAQGVNHFLAGLEHPKLIDEGHTALRNKISGVPEVAANVRLRDRCDGGP